MKRKRGKTGCRCSNKTSKFMYTSPAPIQEWKKHWIFPPHPRYLRLALLQVWGWTQSLYQANYADSNPLSNAFWNSWKLQNEKGFIWLKHLPYSKKFICFTTLQLNCICSHPDCTVETGWQQKPHKHFVAWQLQWAVNWDSASRGHYKIGYISPRTSHKLELPAPWDEPLLKILDKVPEWRYTCWKTACSVQDHAVKENGCEQTVSKWLSKTVWLSGFSTLFIKDVFHNAEES